MSNKVIINAPEAPAPVGAYSQALKSGDLVYIAGQIAIDPATGQMIDGDAAAQTERILKSVSIILSFAGLTDAHVVRCTVFVTDLADMPHVDRVFGAHFSYEPPVRTAVQVAALPMGARIEIEVTAHIPAMGGM